MNGELIDYRRGREIPDRVFLAAVWKEGGRGMGAGVAMRWDVDRILGGFGPDDDLSEGVPGVPWKVSRQKARRLIKRGLLDGCDCGCRGDYYLTDRGKALLFGTVHVAPAGTDLSSAGWVEVGYLTETPEPADAGSVVLGWSFSGTATTGTFEWTGPVRVPTVHDAVFDPARLLRPGGSLG